MTKKELFEALIDIDDDKEILFGYPIQRGHLSVRKCQKVEQIGKNICVVSVDYIPYNIF